MLSFKRIFVFIILFISFFTANSNSEVVNKVEVSGNERISIETIIIYGDIELGKNYEGPDINILIKKLFETTFFSTIFFFT